MSAFKFIRRLADALFIKNWRIGITNFSAEELFKAKRFPSAFVWLPEYESNYFHADPFIYADNNRLVVYCEELSRKSFKGQIRMFELDTSFRIKHSSIVMESPAHLSFPFIFSDSGALFMLPESSEQGLVKAWQVDKNFRAVTDPKVLLQHPLLDSNIIHYSNRYWLFGTMPGKQDDLHIFYSDKFEGPYLPHKGNPVKTGNRGARPAGAIQVYEGKLFRPSQNNTEEYGKSIILWEVTTLTTEDYEEREFLSIDASQLAGKFERIHTINMCGGYLVVDAAVKEFAPLMQMKRVFRKQ